MYRNISSATTTPENQQPTSCATYSVEKSHFGGHIRKLSPPKQMNKYEQQRHAYTVFAYGVDPNKPLENQMQNNNRTPSAGKSSPRNQNQNNHSNNINNNDNSSTSKPQMTAYEEYHRNYLLQQQQQQQQQQRPPPPTARPSTANNRKVLDEEQKSSSKKNSPPTAKTRPSTASSFLRPQSARSTKSHRCSFVTPSPSNNYGYGYQDYTGLKALKKEFLATKDWIPGPVPMELRQGVETSVLAKVCLAAIALRDDSYVVPPEAKDAEDEERARQEEEERKRKSNQKKEEFDFCDENVGDDGDDDGNKDKEKENGTQDPNVDNQNKSANNNHHNNNTQFKNPRPPSSTARTTTNNTISPSGRRKSAVPPSNNNQNSGASFRSGRFDPSSLTSSAARNQQQNNHNNKVTLNLRGLEDARSLDSVSYELIHASYATDNMWDLPYKSFRIVYLRQATLHLEAFLRSRQSANRVAAIKILRIIQKAGRGFVARKAFCRNVYLIDMRPIMRSIRKFIINNNNTNNSFAQQPQTGNLIVMFREEQNRHKISQDEAVGFVQMQDAFDDEIYAKNIRSYQEHPRDKAESYFSPSTARATAKKSQQQPSPSTLNKNNFNNETSPSSLFRIAPKDESTTPIGVVTSPSAATGASPASAKSQSGKSRHASASSNHHNNNTITSHLLPFKELQHLRPSQRMTVREHASRIVQRFMKMASCVVERRRRASLVYKKIRLDELREAQSQLTQFAKAKFSSFVVEWTFQTLVHRWARSRVDHVILSWVIRRRYEKQKQAKEEARLKLIEERERHFAAVRIQHWARLQIGKLRKIHRQEKLEKANEKRITNELHLWVVDTVNAFLRALPWGRTIGKMLAVTKQNDSWKAEREKIQETQRRRVNAGLHIKGFIVSVRKINKLKKQRLLMRSRSEKPSRDSELAMAQSIVAAFARGVDSDKTVREIYQEWLKRQPEVVAEEKRVEEKKEDSEQQDQKAEPLLEENRPNSEQKESAATHINRFCSANHQLRSLRSDQNERIETASKESIVQEEKIEADAASHINRFCVANQRLRSLRHNKTENSESDAKNSVTQEQNSAATQINQMCGAKVEATNRRRRKAERQRALEVESIAQEQGTEAEIVQSHGRAKLSTEHVEEVEKMRRRHHVERRQSKITVEESSSSSEEEEEEEEEEEKEKVEQDESDTPKNELVKRKDEEIEEIDTPPMKALVPQQQQQQSQNDEIIEVDTPPQRSLSVKQVKSGNDKEEMKEIENQIILDQKEKTVPEQQQAPHNDDIFEIDSPLGNEQKNNSAAEQEKKDEVEEIDTPTTKIISIPPRHPQPPATAFGASSSNNNNNQNTLQIQSILSGSNRPASSSSSRKRVAIFEPGQTPKKAEHETKSDDFANKNNNNDEEKIPVQEFATFQSVTDHQHQEYQETKNEDGEVDHQEYDHSFNLAAPNNSHANRSALFQNDEIEENQQQREGKFNQNDDKAAVIVGTPTPSITNSAEDNTSSYQHLPSLLGESLPLSGQSPSHHNKNNANHHQNDETSEQPEKQQQQQQPAETSPVPVDPEPPLVLERKSSRLVVITPALDDEEEEIDDNISPKKDPSQESSFASQKKKQHVTALPPRITPVPDSQSPSRNDFGDNEHEQTNNNNNNQQQQADLFTLQDVSQSLQFGSDAGSSPPARVAKPQQNQDQTPQEAKASHDAFFEESLIRSNASASPPLPPACLKRENTAAQLPALLELKQEKSDVANNENENQQRQLVRAESVGPIKSSTPEDANNNSHKDNHHNDTKRLSHVNSSIGSSKIVMSSSDDDESSDKEAEEAPEEEEL